jgi:hypothetical protein
MEWLVDRLDRQQSEVEISVRILAAPWDAFEEALQSMDLSSASGDPLRLEPGALNRLERLSQATPVAASRLGLVGSRLARLESSGSGSCAAKLTARGHVHPGLREVTLEIEIRLADLAATIPGQSQARADLEVATSARVADGATLLVPWLPRSDGPAAVPRALVVALTPTIVHAPLFDPAELEPLAIGTESRISLDEQ